MTESTKKSNLSRSILLLLIALVVLILLTIFCALPKVYQHIYDETGKILSADEKYSQVEFDTNKTQVYLSGFLTDTEIQPLIDKVSDIFAVSKVDFIDKTIEVAPEYDKVKFSLQTVGTKLNLNGEVAAVELVDFANANLADFEIENNLATNKNLPLWWDKQQFEYLLNLTKNLADLTVVLDETLTTPVLQVSGTVIDAEEFGADAQAKITNQLANLFPDSLALSVDIKYPEVVEEVKVEEPVLYGLTECQTKINEQLAQAPVLFARAKSELNKASKDSLEEVAKIIALCEADLKFAIGGHTDSRGNESINVPLSKARAKVATDYLVNNAGVAQQRFTAKGYSANEPVADNASEEGRRLNRRIEINVKSN